MRLRVTLPRARRHHDCVESTDPFTATPTWTYATDDPGDNSPGRNAGVSCASVDLCLVAEGGGVAVSTDAGAPSPTWTEYGTPDGAPGQGSSTYIYGLSCPSSLLCVADDGNGGVLTSTDPGQGSQTFVRQDVDGANVMSSMSCYSTSLCLATDEEGNVLSSTDPSDASSTWTLTHIDSSPLTDVACASATQCVAVDNAGNLVVSTAASGGTGSGTTGGTGSGTTGGGTTGGTSGGGGRSLEAPPPLPARRTPARSRWRGQVPARASRRCR